MREHDQTLGVDKLRGIGFRAQDGDEWRGPMRETHRAAAADAREYNRDARQVLKSPS